MWLLVGVFVLWGGQPSDAGAREHGHTGSGSGTHRSHVIHRYVALGDSYTAGAGIPPGDLTGCYRSRRNYPHHIDDRLDTRRKDELQDASCGAATTASVENAQTTFTSTNPPQLSAVDDHTDLVTVSLGVNDAGLAQLLYACGALAPSDPAGAPCETSFNTAQGNSLLTNMPAVGEGVERVLGLVKAQAPHARVLLVGYPQLVPPTGMCAQLPFAAGDYAYVRTFFTTLDATMEMAAARAGVDYVDVLKASRGHDVCAGSEAWVDGVVATGRAMAYHPFANEQRAVASLVLDTIK
jgi:lysophospholipase L1-like esterase